MLFCIADSQEALLLIQLWAKCVYREEAWGVCLSYLFCTTLLVVRSNLRGDVRVKNKQHLITVCCVSLPRFHLSVPLFCMFILALCQINDRMWGLDDGSGKWYWWDASLKRILCFRRWSIAFIVNAIGLFEWMGMQELNSFQVAKFHVLDESCSDITVAQRNSPSLETNRYNWAKQKKTDMPTTSGLRDYHYSWNILVVFAWLTKWSSRRQFCSNSLRIKIKLSNPLVIFALCSSLVLPRITLAYTIASAILWFAPWCISLSFHRMKIQAHLLCSLH